MSVSLSTDHWIASAGGRLFARQWPAPEAASPAAPIVLMHDSLGCVDLWRDFPALLAAASGRRVFAYDRLGFGRSDPRAARPSFAFDAEEATTGFAALRAQMAIDRFAVVGHSVGGGMAVEIAAQWSPACEALVTLSAQAFVEQRTLAGLREARVHFEDAEQVRRLARYHGDKADWALDAWLGTWLDPAFREWSLDAVLPRVACPVLAIHGEQDEYGSPAHPKRIGELAAGTSRVVVLPGVGHVPHREQPQRVVGLVAEFLATTSA